MWKLLQSSLHAGKRYIYYWVCSENVTRKTQSRANSLCIRLCKTSREVWLSKWVVSQTESLRDILWSILSTLSIKLNTKSFLPENSGLPQAYQQEGMIFLWKMNVFFFVHLHSITCLYKSCKLLGNTLFLKHVFQGVQFLSLISISLIFNWLYLPTSDLPHSFTLLLYYTKLPFIFNIYFNIPMNMRSPSVTENFNSQTNMYIYM